MKIILALLIFSAIILFHELGHFLLAKKNKIVVTEFSLGMGPRLFSTETVSYTHLDVYKRQEKGLTLVPIKVYFKNSLVKVEIGMARGKKLYDKRQDIAKKDQRREAERDFKVKNLY